MSLKTKFDLGLGEAGSFVSELAPCRVRELINVTGFHLEGIIDAYVAHTFEYELPDQPRDIQQEVIDQVKHFRARGTWMSRSSLITPPQTQGAQQRAEAQQTPCPSNAHAQFEPGPSASYSTPTSHCDEDVMDWVGNDHDNIPDTSIIDECTGQGQIETVQAPEQDTGYPSPGSHTSDHEDATMEEAEDIFPDNLSEIPSRSPSLTPSLHRLNLHEESVESDYCDLHLPEDFQFPELADVPEEPPSTTSDGPDNDNTYKQRATRSHHAGSQSFMMPMAEERTVRSDNNDVRPRGDGQPPPSSHERSPSPYLMPEELQALLAESEALAANQHVHFDDAIPSFEGGEEDEVPDQQDSSNKPMQDWTTNDGPWHDVDMENDETSDNVEPPTPPVIIDLTDEEPSTSPSATSLHEFSSTPSCHRDTIPPSTPRTPPPKGSQGYHWLPAEVYLANKIRKLAADTNFILLPLKGFRDEVECEMRVQTQVIDDLRMEVREKDRRIEDLERDRDEQREHNRNVMRMFEQLQARLD